MTLPLQVPTPIVLRPILLMMSDIERERTHTITVSAITTGQVAGEDAKQTS